MNAVKNGLVLSPRRIASFINNVTTFLKSTETRMSVRLSLILLLREESLASLKKRSLKSQKTDC